MGYKEKLYPHEDSPAVEQGPREIVSSPSMEIFQALTGQSPEQPGGGQAAPALSCRRLDWRPPEVAINLQVDVHK